MGASAATAAAIVNVQTAAVVVIQTAAIATRAKAE
jgi:hypothetical protein